MTIHETRLTIAVDVAVRSRQGASAATIGAAFGAAHAVLLRLGGSNTWDQSVLEAAWDLARGAVPRGADLDVNLAALVAAYDAVASVQGPGRVRSRPRREAAP
jgi:enolase